MSWEIQEPVDAESALTRSGLNANNLTVNFGDGVTPELPENAVITKAIVTPASGTVDASQWTLLRSNGSVDDVVSDAAQDVTKRLIKVRGLSNLALGNITLKVFYAIN